MKTEIVQTNGRRRPPKTMLQRIEWAIDRARRRIANLDLREDARELARLELRHQRKLLMRHIHSGGKL